MASNFFGQIFRITTFGESHGAGVGVVIDGCPAGLPVTQEEVNQALVLRRPGNSPYTSPRKEADLAEILSGVFEGKTTGAPIAIFIRNSDADSSQYASIKDLYRPGHANFTYLHKYGIFDDRGGGRASARETAARVAAGAIAKKFLAHYGIFCTAYIAELGGIEVAPQDFSQLETLQSKTYSSPIFCPDVEAAERMMQRIALVKEERDSLGAIVACLAKVPVGLGDPVYQKLEAQLASAMLSLPATKGFEIGSGFNASRMRGSEHNDLFDRDESGNVFTRTNFSGGTLGGISTGSSIFFRVAFKPTSSIKQPQETLNVTGERALLQFPTAARHDPCVAIRAVPIVEAMAALVLADAVLMQRCSNL